MQKSNRRALLGIVFIVIGTLFLMDNLNIFTFDLPYYLINWQVLLIVIGGFQLFSKNKKGGFILIAIGSIFLLPLYFDFSIRDYWPLILIAIGIGFFLKNRTKIDRSEDSDYIDDIAVLSSSNKKIYSQEFGGGKITATLGGMELDLRQSSLANGQATLDSFAMLGGIKILIPEDWVVNFEATTVLGGFDDKRPHKPTEYFGNVLSIKGMIFLGTIELNS
jgi:predicted membrane protein